MGLFLIFFGMGMLIILAYLLSPFSRRSQVYSPYVLLTASWENYKSRFINQDGQVVDSSQGGITTSEGQSYAMLQAVWVDDKKTFDKVWQWTKTYLKRKNDNLFGWRYKNGFLPGGGENSASDADSDISLALILASRRWSNRSYLDSAKPIIADIWNKETTQVKDSRYLIAGNWANENNTVIINPSYFAPYAWRIFNQVDPKHDWSSLIDPAYQLLNESGKNNLGSATSVGLPPDWLSMDKKNGEIKATNISGQTTDYSFDAIRIPWRVAVDYLINHEEQAKNYLNSLSFLNKQYEKKGKLNSSYRHDGTAVSENENPAMYATSLGYFLVVNPELAKKIYKDKILSLYSSDQNSFKKDIPYYETNWLWFGAAYFNHDVTVFK